VTDGKTEYGQMFNCLSTS